jgi:decaprenyl-phosphate phosphoribosyltransferase
MLSGFSSGPVAQASIYWFGPGSNRPAVLCPSKRLDGLMADLSIPKDDYQTIIENSGNSGTSVRAAHTSLKDLVLTARPRQWAKNVLVFGAPATGSVLLQADAMLAAFAAFVSFCLAASGVYFVNDLVDRIGDREHPKKRLRPIAAGRIPARVAIAAGSVLMTAGLVIGVLGAGWALGAVVAGYIALTLAYAFWLRNVALFDITAIAGGFLLRAVAGGVAVEVPLSMWFLMVAAFGSLFIAAGKRHAEFISLGGDRGNHRRVLQEYSEPYLRFIQNSSATVAIAAYSLWAFEGEVGGTLWSALSIIPFVLAILRYALVLESGRGGTPEDIVLSDPPLLGVGVAWVLLVTTGVYLT